MEKDPNNFIIKDEKWVRDFESMYQNFEDPWDQNKNHLKDVANELAFSLLKNMAEKNNLKIKQILDIGCADGYFANCFFDIFGDNLKLTSTDISKTAISRANIHNQYRSHSNFIVDDCRIFNEDFMNQFDIIFSARTLYYVAPEIKKVIRNIKRYLVGSGGIFIFIYNQKEDSFSNQWLTYQGLRNILKTSGFMEQNFIEHSDTSSEKIGIGSYILK